MKKPDEIKKGLEYLSIKDIVKKLDMWKEGIAYDYAEDAAADALAYIQQLEAKAPKWISVKDQMPTGEDPVLILVKETEHYGLHKENGKFITVSTWRIGTGMNGLRHGAMGAEKFPIQQKSRMRTITK